MAVPQGEGVELFGSSKLASPQVRKTQHWSARRDSCSDYWGLDTFFTVGRTSGEWLEESQLNKFNKAARAMLFGYHALSSEASAFGRPRGEMRPKHYVLWHVWRDTPRTKRNPCWQWAVCDEDSMMKYVRVSAASHPSTIPRSALERCVLGVWELSHNSS